MKRRPNTWWRRPNGPARTGGTRPPWAGFFRRLNPIPFHVQVLPRCRFLHFGTTRQLITSGLELLPETTGTTPANELLALNNLMGPGGAITAENRGSKVAGSLRSWKCRATMWVVGADIMRHPLTLLPGACLNVVPGRNRRGQAVWFVRWYDLNDTFKDTVAKGDTFCGRPLLKWLAAVNVPPEEIWPGGANIGQCALWDARVFPATADCGDYRAWQWMFTDDERTDQQRSAFRAADRYSAAEVAVLADQDAFHERRAGAGHLSGQP